MLHCEIYFLTFRLSAVVKSCSKQWLILPRHHEGIVRLVSGQYFFVRKIRKLQTSMNTIYVQYYEIL